MHLMTVPFCSLISKNKCNKEDKNISVIGTLKEDDDAVVDKLVTDDSESMEPPFLRLDSEP